MFTKLNLDRDGWSRWIKDDESCEVYNRKLIGYYDELYLEQKIFASNTCGNSIKRKNYEANKNERWSVFTDCELVHIYSKSFKKDTSDVFTIEGVNFNDNETIVQIVPTNFTILFLSHDRSNLSDAGFELQWNCITTSKCPYKIFLEKNGSTFCGIISLNLRRLYGFWQPVKDI